MESLYAFLLAFSDEHWFLAWCALWLAWPVVCLPLWLLTFFRSLMIRTFRAIVVLLRGWPPAHLDADGDWPTEPKSGE